MDYIVRQQLMGAGGYLEARSFRQGALFKPLLPARRVGRLGEVCLFPQCWKLSPGPYSLTKPHTELHRQPCESLWFPPPRNNLEIPGPRGLHPRFEALLSS